MGLQRVFSQRCLLTEIGNYRGSLDLLDRELAKFIAERVDRSHPISVEHQMAVETEHEQAIAVVATVVLTYVAKRPPEELQIHGSIGKGRRDGGLQ